MGLEFNGDQIVKDQIKRNLDAEALINKLVESEAVVTLELVRPPSERVVTVRHSRDVASETDSMYIKEESVESDIKDAVGWMLPFDANGRTAFAIISRDYTSSIHFIQDMNRNVFERSYRDQFIPGKVKHLYTDEDVNHIHLGGLHIQFEDVLARLTPSNPDHIKKIDELLLIALDQSFEKLYKSMQAQEENKQNTANILSSFMKKLRGETD